MSELRLGFGLYYHMLGELERHLDFAVQCGATDVVVHLVDYFHQGEGRGDDSSTDQPIGGAGGWGISGSNPEVWELEYLHRLKERIAAHGLNWYAVENFDPSDWYAVLLGLPEREQQIVKLRQIIRNLGRIGVSCMGYNFSIAGVSSRSTGPYARGGAQSVGMDGIPQMPEIPQGMVWNMIYDQELYARALREGLTQERCSEEELWRRLSWFLRELLPTAEESNVMLCAHPDDPPLERVRSQARLVIRPELYEDLIAVDTSWENGLELCLGTLQEMHTDVAGSEVYDFLESYIEQRRVGYIHLRNVRGKVPYYKEVFIDEGDLDVRRVMNILERCQFSGVIIPDHVPQMSCPAPWYAGMAFAMGYLKALMPK